MEKCKCTICTLGRFPQTEKEVTVFEEAHKNDPVPSDEFFADQFQQILLLIEIDKLLK